MTNPVRTFHPPTHDPPRHVRTYVRMYVCTSHETKIVFTVVWVLCKFGLAIHLLSPPFPRCSLTMTRHGTMHPHIISLPSPTSPSIREYETIRFTFPGKLAALCIHPLLISISEPDLSRVHSVPLTPD